MATARSKPTNTSAARPLRSRSRRIVVPMAWLITVLTACGGGNGSTGAGSSATAASGSDTTATVTAPDGNAAPTTTTSTATPPTVTSGAASAVASPSTSAPSFVIVDRLDFGASASEAAHALNAASTKAPAGTGAFSQTYRQPTLIKSGATPAASDKLTFTMAVDATKQNYLTVKLWGSDIQFGVLHLADLSIGDGEVAFDQFDNNISHGTSNPPFFGRFHYATVPVPLAMTSGKTSVTLSMYSSGYYYADGGSLIENGAVYPTRAVYSAFTHVEPSFVPPAADKTGTALAQAGLAPPGVIDKATVFRVLKRSRANIYNLDGVPDGFWNPGGTLALHGSVIPAGTAGAPPEVIGMHMWDGPLLQKDIDAINATADPALTWRKNVGDRQMTAISLYTALYLTPPLKDADGNTVTGYDRYLDPVMLDRLIALIDGHARTRLASWTPPSSAGWWDDTWSPVGRAVLRLLENPTTAATFKSKLLTKISVDGKMITRAAHYEKFLAGSGDALGFNPKALTSDDYFDKFGGTVEQSMIWVGNAYPCQVALRALQKIDPSADADKQPLASADMRAIVRQLAGLDDMKYMNPATPGYRTITKGGMSETYGNAASGYDGRYGGGSPQHLARMAMVAKYDESMSAADRDDLTAVTRRVIGAFDEFLYPQHVISTDKDGNATDTYALGQEDVISWRVPYGPNANGWYLNVQTLSVDPNGPIKSAQARRSFLLQAGRDGPNSLIGDMDYYNESEAAWNSIAGVDPATVTKLPGEPGAPDFVWADTDSGALALAYKGERLFLNANYNRDQNKVNQYVRVHHVTDTVDREATVRMPFNAATAQSDGNLSGDFHGAWVVRYGRYLVVMNRGTTAYTAHLPAGTGQAVLLHSGGSAAMGGTVSVPVDGYEVFVLPS